MIVPDEFKDCLGRNDTGCCEYNKQKADYYLTEFGPLFTPEERERIRRCIDAAYLACLDALHAGRRFLRDEWHRCFEGKILFVRDYPESPEPGAGRP